MLERTEQPDGVVVLRTRKGFGALYTAEEPPTLVMIIGHFIDEELCQRIIAECETRITARGITCSFFDAYEVDGYVSELRTGMTSLMRRTGAKGVHVLFRSRIVAMGVAMAGLALGGAVVSYAKRADFENGLRERSPELRLRYRRMLEVVEPWVK